MREKNLDLIGAIFFTLLCVGWAQLPSRPLIVGIMLAVPLVLVLPGYTLTQVLFRKRSLDPLTDTANNLTLQPRLRIDHPVSAVDYIIFSLGLSLAIDVVMGFILNLFPMGLQLQSWTISLGLLTSAFALLATYRRRRYNVKFEKISMPRISIYKCLVLGLAIVVAFVAVWFSTTRQPQPQTSFTQFWMLPSTQANNSCAVQIGVHSYEPTSVTYRIVMAINGTQVISWPSIFLATQQEWDRLVPINPVATGSMFVDARLYRLDKPEAVYREVHVTLPSCPTLRSAPTP
jgi:uncharacterized membrane protein